MEEFEKTAKLQDLAQRLIAARKNKKVFEELEERIKKEMATLWGPITLSSETRVFGDVNLTARRQTRTDYDYDEFSKYLSLRGDDYILDLVEERTIDKKKVDAIVKQGDLPSAVKELLREVSSYVVWVAEERKF